MANRTLNWTGTLNANWNNLANWVDQATGIAPLSAPDAGDDCRFGVGTGATNTNCTINSGSIGRSWLVDGYTGTITHTSGITLVLGDATAGLSGVAISFVTTGWTYTLGSATTSAISLVSTSTAPQTINLNTKNVANFTVNGVGSVYQATTAINNTSSATVTLTTGSLDLTGLTCNWGRFGMNNTNAKTLNITNATINLNNNGTIWSASSASIANTTFTSTGSTINITEVSATSRSFAATNLTYGTVNYTVSGATGQLTISGSAIYDTFNFSDASNARTLVVSGNTTNIFRVLNVQGTSGKLMTINSSTGGSINTFLQKSGTGIWSMDYLSVTDIRSNNAYVFYAGGNSTDGGNNVAIHFTVPNTIQRYQTAGNNVAPGTSVTATFASPTTAGRLLVACFNLLSGGSAVQAPSGWTQAATRVNTATGFIWYKIASGSETTVQVTWTGSVNADLYIAEFLGFSGTPTLDATDGVSSAGSVTTLSSAGTSPSPATVPALSVIQLGASGTTGSQLATNGYDIEFTTGNGVIASRLTPSFKPLEAIAAQDTTFSWSVSRAAFTMTAMFKGVISAAPQMMTLGMG